MSRAPLRGARICARTVAPWVTMALIAGVPIPSIAATESEAPASQPTAAGDDSPRSAATSGSPSGASVEASAPAAVPTEPMRGRIDISHAYSDDDQTALHQNYSDVRATFSGSQLFGIDGLRLVLDGRGRYSYNTLTRHRLLISNAYLQLGHPERVGFSPAVGRQIINEAGSAEVDGVRLSRRFNADTTACVFAGLVPHPLTGAINTRFSTTGFGYASRKEGLNHAGGAVLQMYTDKVDRLYVTERAVARLGRTLVLAGFAIVDLSARRGLLADVNNVSTDAQSGADRIDITHLDVMARYRPVPLLDFMVQGAHHHTILPNRWLQDWLDQERRKRGFVIDGDDPVGTRTTTVRLTTNLNLSTKLVPYVRGRYDYRHNDGGKVYEGRGGIKWRGVIAYVDANAVARRYYATDNRALNITVGSDFSTDWGGEASGTMMLSAPRHAARADVLYDYHVLGWLDLGILGVRGLRLALQYQGFVEPQIFYQVFFAQIGYRFTKT